MCKRASEACGLQLPGQNLLAAGWDMQAAASWMHLHLVMLWHAATCRKPCASVRAPASKGLRRLLLQHLT